jgi:hypothetical protein
VRIDGPVNRPVAALTHSANQSITNSTATALAFDTEREDTQDQHFTSSANLTGTVAKTNGSDQLVGTGTSFTTELSVGQLIEVPGTAAEKRVVTAIADNTHLTVNANFANTAAGQTATRKNTALVCREAGFYIVGGAVRFATNATGLRDAVITLNGTQRARQRVMTTTTGGGAYLTVTTGLRLALWDYVELQVLQTSGGALNVELEADSSPEFWWAKLRD